jgi:hypothetical protein
MLCWRCNAQTKDISRTDCFALAVTAYGWRNSIRHEEASPPGEVRVGGNGRGHGDRLSVALASPSAPPRPARPVFLIRFFEGFFDGRIELRRDRSQDVGRAVSLVPSKGNFPLSNYPQRTLDGPPLGVFAHVLCRFVFSQVVPVPRFGQACRVLYGTNTLRCRKCRVLKYQSHTKRRPSACSIVRTRSGGG